MEINGVVYTRAQKVPDFCPLYGRYWIVYDNEWRARGSKGSIVVELEDYALLPPNCAVKHTENLPLNAYWIRNKYRRP